jgi:hypothetical protein
MEPLQEHLWWHELEGGWGWQQLGRVEMADSPALLPPGDEPVTRLFAGKSPMVRIRISGYKLLEASCPIKEGA